MNTTAAEARRDIDPPEPRLRKGTRPLGTPPSQGGDSRATKPAGIPKSRGADFSSAQAPARQRSGLTLTEILIAIMILGVGLVSLATLFPVGLLRLRDAARYSRSAYLTESAAADATSRGLLNKQSFFFADQLNWASGLQPWYYSPPLGVQYDPFTQDTDYYGGRTVDLTTNPPTVYGAQSRGLGLPFAYDPLWRYFTVNPGNPHANYGGNVNSPTGGYYLFDSGALEARFGSGIGFIRSETNDPNNSVPSAHGLQRLTNFNRPYITSATGQVVPFMSASLAVPGIFVSPEDVVWVEPDASTGLSPVLPDLNIPSQPGSATNDWRYSWMFTGQQTNTPIAGASTSLAATFDGNIVIFESRPFGITVPPVIPNPPPPLYQAYQVDGETVVEAVFGYSSNVVPVGGPGYGASADRTVLLRWPTGPSGIPDPVVRVGDWIADVTYERSQPTVLTRYLGWGNPAGGLPNPTDNLEWDNLPAQRCFWYQVQKVVPPVNAVPFNGDPGPYRSMVVYVNSSLQSRTVLQGNGQPYFTNAALISPYVVNVIPQTIFVR